MAGRRLAVALPTTAPPPPPPRPLVPDGPSGANGRRLSPSLASLLSGDFVSRPRYRCCCRWMHLKTASFLIGVADTLGMSAAFGRGLHLGLSMQHNPMAVAWFVISSLMFVLGFACTLAMFYGVWREHYLWIVPKLVMKISAVVLYSATTVAMVYMMMEHSQYLLDLVAEHVTKSDYEAARVALRTGGGGLAVGFLLMALAHVWFFYILYRCYKYLKDRYFWRKSRLANNESNENHVAAVLASISSTSPLPSGVERDLGARTLSNLGRNGNGSIRSRESVRRDNRDVAATNSRSPASVTELGSIPLQVLTSTAEADSRNRPGDAVPCSCYSPMLPVAGSDKEMLWKGFNQTHV